MSMRGIDTEVRKIRRRVFYEVTKLAYTSDDIIDDIEALPYKIVNYDAPVLQDTIYRERAVVRERLRLALGMSLRPENLPVNVSSGVAKSDSDEKYYEPPLMQVIPSGCRACPMNDFSVTNACMGCNAHPCVAVCPVGAVSFDGIHAQIDKEKCIQCGKCKAVCPYDAISHKIRPCIGACGVGAIKEEAHGRAKIDNDICVSCGMCMVSCPFGAIADKSQIFQLTRSLRKRRKVVAQVAPAFAGQFGDKVTAGMLKEALKRIGFFDVYETAIGADEACIKEAGHYVERVVSGQQDFLLTSCCPSWAMMAKHLFPESIDRISNELTPMVATARMIKRKMPDASVVFIGPCAAKKLEAMRRTVRSDVDFVITFEELQAMFDAFAIDLNNIETDETLEDATFGGRIYGIAGGVAGAIEECVKNYYPEAKMKIEHCEGLSECKKMLMMAKAGLKKGVLIEGMGCPGGCVAGAGTIENIAAAKKSVEAFAGQAKEKLPKLQKDTV